MTREEAIKSAVDICTAASEEEEPDFIGAFEAAAWEANIMGIRREAGRNQEWEDPAIAQYNASLSAGYSRDMGWLFCTLYSYPELPLEFVAGRVGNTGRFLLYPPNFDGKRLPSSAW